MKYAESQLRRRCAERGLDWDKMPEEQRNFVDDLMHEGPPVRPIAVFDTNVLFSGVAWKGTPFEGQRFFSVRFVG